MKRKGYSLVELLVVISIITFLSIPIAHLNIITLRDIPRSYKMIQTNTTILNALNYIKRDVNTATSFPTSHGQYKHNDQTLLIQTDQEVIIYQFKEDQIIRLKCKDNHVSNDTIVWSTPRAKIQWKLWQKDNLRALEIRTYIEHESGEAINKKLKNIHLFFANALYMAGNTE
ncbi:MAG: PulJ/GspJ family protein [Planctomycetota bacterium]|jgi:prepilin-type N-terminal cleavage/methylation domain-containing protein